VLGVFGFFGNLLNSIFAKIFWWPFK
jgi:hypothetical protein